MPTRPKPLPAKASVARCAISEIRCVRTQLAQLGISACSGGLLRSIVAIIYRISERYFFSSFVAVITAEGLDPLSPLVFRAKAKL